MSIATVVELKDPGFVWLDVVQPTAEELAGIAELPAPSHLGERLPRPRAPAEVRGLRRLHLRDSARLGPAGGADLLYGAGAHPQGGHFHGRGFLITIHRTEQPWLTTVEARLAAEVRGEAAAGETGQLVPYVLTKLLNGVLDTYFRPMEAMEGRLDQFEETVFSGTVAPGSLRRELREIHLLKRQVTLTKRLSGAPWT
jgi:Mg2+ and Co2+ transporter CorA